MILTAALSYLSNLPQGLFNLLLPPRCFNCAIPINEPKAICHNCWKNLNFIMAPQCVKCGRPFEFEIGVGAICGRCLINTTNFNQARAALYYNDHSKRMILRFKHGDAVHLTPLFARWMYQCGPELLANADYMVPVPLHWGRLLKRQYNQAALLCHALAKLSGCRVAAQLLHRTRSTPPQGRLKSAQRHQNVSGAFKIHKDWRHKVKGLNLLLIDDVVTSGATLKYCAATLLEAGAGEVNVLTLAKVI